MSLWCSYPSEPCPVSLFNNHRPSLLGSFGMFCRFLKLNYFDGVQLKGDEIDQFGSCYLGVRMFPCVQMEPFRLLSPHQTTIWSILTYQSTQTGIARPGPRMSIKSFWMSFGRTWNHPNTIQPNEMADNTSGPPFKRQGPRSNIRHFE